MIAMAGNLRVNNTWDPFDSYSLTKTLQFLKDFQFNLEFLMIFIVLFLIISLILQIWKLLSMYAVNH